MSLRETENKIYSRPEKSETSQPLASNKFRQNEAEEAPFAASSFGASGLDEKKEIWIRQQEEKKENRKKILKKVLIVAVVVVAVVGIVWGALYFRKTSFSEDQVKVTLASPGKVKSGESVDIKIDYQNLNRASLKGAVLYLKYSENFKPSGNLQLESEGPTVSKFNIGDIKGKGDGQVTIQGKFFGATDALVYLEARLEYKSSTFNSTFASSANSSVYISSSPLTVEISGPLNAASGNAVSYIISYRNTGQEDFNDLKIKAEYPSGFAFSNSEPLTSQENNIWYVGNLAAGQSGQVKINGKIDGERDQEKTISVSIGEFGAGNDFIAYGQAQSTLKIVGSPIVVSETVNGKSDVAFVNAGDTLIFEVNYKNTGTIALRDVILTLNLDSPILEYSQMEMRSGKGAYDEGKKTVTWKPSDVPEFKSLAPNAQGKIAFAIPVKSIIPVKDSKDKNFMFSAEASMDSPDIPTPEGSNKVIASNSVDVKLNSKLITNLLGYYNDPDISNSGPLPPKVGQETTFTMHLKAANVSNDVTDAKLVATLAPGVTWKNNFKPESASVDFNDRTNEITWNLGSISAGTGIITDPKELIFQIGVTPQANQAGNFLPLISGVDFTAKDAFTAQPLETKLTEKNTNLTEDLGVAEMGKAVN
jgi:uncharacterized repeat protein (TIGR01451 family)